MYVIREMLNRKPGTVRPMLEKFRALSRVVDDHDLVDSRRREIHRLEG